MPGVHPGRAVVFGVPDAREGTELVAVIAEVTTDDPDERKVINKTIRQEVVRQSMVTVSYVHLVGERWLIKTSSGKLPVPPIEISGWQNINQSNRGG